MIVIFLLELKPILFHHLLSHEAVIAADTGHISVHMKVFIEATGLKVTRIENFRRWKIPELAEI